MLKQCGIALLMNGSILNNSMQQFLSFYCLTNNFIPVYLGKNMPFQAGLLCLLLLMLMHKVTVS